MDSSFYSAKSKGVNQNDSNRSLALLPLKKQSYINNESINPKSSLAVKTIQIGVTQSDDQIFVNATNEMPISLKKLNSDKQQRPFGSNTTRVKSLHGNQQNWCEASSIHSIKSYKSSSIGGSLFDQSLSPLENRVSEFQALESIIDAQDFHVIQAPSVDNLGHYLVRVRPQSTRPEENFCWVILEISYSNGYPNTSQPSLLKVLTTDQQFDLKQKQDSGITSQDLVEINSEVASLALSYLSEKRLVVYDVIVLIQDILDRLNQQRSQYVRHRQKVMHQELLKHLSGAHDPEQSIRSFYTAKQGDESPLQESSNDSLPEFADVPESFERSRIRSLQRKVEIKLHKEGYQQRRELASAMEVNQNNNMFELQQQDNIQFELMQNQAPPTTYQAGGVSRYKLDFQELSKIGEGGGGSVFKVQHKVDRNFYAIKKVRLHRRNQAENERIELEANIISRLHHQHIVRYFQSWIEYIDDEDEIKELNFSDYSSETDQYNQSIVKEDSKELEYDVEEDSYIAAPTLTRNRSKTQNDIVERDVDDSESEYYAEDDDYYCEISSAKSSDYDLKLDGRNGTKGNKKTKRDKFSKKSYFERKHFKVNKSKQINKKVFKALIENPVLPMSLYSKKSIKVLYIQMEYCEGRSLRNFISEGLKSDEQNWKIFAQIVDALHYLHSQGLIHRDIKPANIFLDKKNNVKLGDFGLATASSNNQLLPKHSSGIQQTKKPTNMLHSVGVGTPLYMAPEQRRGNTGAYNYLADMYSLGLIFFEMCIGGFQSFLEMDKVFTHLRSYNEIDSEYRKKVPADAIKLILWLVQEDPSKRPSTTTLLQSELMPQNLQDGVFRKFVHSISNHKTVESIQLMNFLMKRKTAKNIDLTYEGFTPLELQKSVKAMANEINGGDRAIIIRSNMKAELKKIFIIHGAIDLDIPSMCPLQNSQTAFISLSQQVVTDERRKSYNSTEGTVAKNDQVYFAEIDCSAIAIRQISDITNHSNSYLLKYLQDRDLQLVTYFEPSQNKSAFRVLDDTGIVLQMQSNLQTNFARFAARRQLPFIKRYHIGKVYEKGSTQSQLRTSPQETLEATFDIVSLQSGSHYQGDDLIYEAEAIKVCDEVASFYQKEIGKYRIKVSSTELIDGIFDECRVRFDHRHLVLAALSDLDNKQWKEVKKVLINELFIEPANADRMGELLKIRGSIVTVEEQIKRIKGLRKPDRFKQVVERFKSMRNYLKYFGVQEEEEGATGSLSFDFGLVLENQLEYYSGLFFKLLVNNTSHYEQEILPSQSPGPKSAIKNILQTDVKKSRQIESKQSFSLPSNLEPIQFGMRKFGKKKGRVAIKEPEDKPQESNKVGLIFRKGAIAQYETLAIGGRYDNVIAHYQPMEVPVAVGVRFSCKKLIQKILYYEIRKKNEIPLQYSRQPFQQVDVYVVSRGDMTLEKMELLSELWRNGIRAEADFGNDFDPQEFINQQMQKARFLVMFKKQVYANTGKFKVRDFDLKMEKDESRDTLVEYIKSRLL